MKYLLSAFLLLLCAKANAQSTIPDPNPPYKKYPILPAFYIFNPDSSSAINTYDIPEGHYTVLIYFSPDCGHCQDLTKEITASLDKDSFRNVGIYMCTPLDLSLLRTFIQQQRLDNYSNIFAGKDSKYFFPGFFKTHHVPQLVVYDEHKKFVKMFEGNFKWAEVTPYLKDVKD